MTEGDILGHEPMGIVEEVGSGVTDLAAGRPGGDPLPDRLRLLLHVRPGAADPVRDHPGARARHGRRAVRLHQALRPGSRRPGRVPARATRRLRSRSRCPRARPTTGSSTSPTCCRPPGRPSSTPASPTGGTLVVLGARTHRRHGQPDRACTAACARHRRRPRRRTPATRAPTRGVETVDLDDVGKRRLGDHIRELTGGRGPGRGHRRRRHGGPRLARHARPLHKLTGLLPDAVAEPMMNKAGIDRLAALHSAIDIVRRGGTISLIGVYGGMADPLPMLTLFDKQVQLRMGQANVKRWVDDILPLLGRRRPAGRRLVRHPPPAPRRGAGRRTRCSRRRRTARSRWSSTRKALADRPEAA